MGFTEFHLSILRKCVVAILILISSVLIFRNLEKPALENWDEAWYGDMTRSMLRTHEFIVPYWNQRVFLDKPPLHIWINTLISSVIGLSELSLRLSSAVSGLLIIAIVVSYANKTWGIVPAFLAFVTLGLNSVFLWRTRSGNTDLFVTLLIVVSFFLMKSTWKRKYILLGFVFTGIYLAKGALVGFPLWIFFIHDVIFFRTSMQKKLWQYVSLILIMIFFIGLWLGLGYQKIGSAFIDYYLFHSDQGVASRELTRFNPNYLLYAYYSLQRWFFSPVILGLVLLMWSWKKSEHVLIFLFSTTLPLVLSFTLKNNNWYLLPSMPFWSLAIAYASYRVTHMWKHAYILSIPILVITLGIGIRTYRINITPILSSGSANAQAQSGKKLSMLTQPNDTIVRLDYLVPTTVYYADRKVFGSPVQSDTQSYWMSRVDLDRAIQNESIHWLVGPPQEIDEYRKTHEGIVWETIRVNDSEAILHVTHLQPVLVH